MVLMKTAWEKLNFRRSSTKFDGNLIILFDTWLVYLREGPRPLLRDTFNWSVCWINKTRVLINFRKIKTMKIKGCSIEWKQRKKRGNTTFIFYLCVFFVHFSADKFHLTFMVAFLGLFLRGPNTYFFKPLRNVFTKR